MGAPLNAAEAEAPMCDDGKRCTANDRLVDETCSGTAYSCHDGLTCTNDLCDGSGGCRHFVASGYCLIDEQCFASNDSEKGNSCRVCDPSHSNLGWYAPSGRPCLGGVCREGSCMVSLNIQRRGPGAGVVLGRRLLCDKDCTFEIQSGARVRLTAEPARGSEFEGWTGACTGAAECVVEMSAGETVFANFTRAGPEAPPVQLIIERLGRGVVTSFPPGVDCGQHCWHTFSHGTTVTLYATPIKGMEFRGWKGGCHGRSRECSVELRAAQMVSAQFATARRHHIPVARSVPPPSESSPGAFETVEIQEVYGPPVPAP